VRLEDKGPIRPAPILRRPMQRVSAAIQAWPGIVAATHWHLSRRSEVDGVDFYVGERELGHVHLDGEVHLATSRELRAALLARGLARPFPWYDSWVEATIRTEADADHALWLFGLNHERLRGAPVEAVLARIAGRSPQPSRSPSTSST
jgi:hypothetical protein